MASTSGKMLKSANPSTLQNKFMVGYQGWFTCAGDGEPIDPGHHGWLHWFNYPIPDGGRPNTDFWPDVSSCSPSELFPAPGLKTASGEQTFLFSSRNAKTVQRHFHWMAEHGVDGAFLQRFAGQCDGDQGIRRLRDEIGERVREAAEREGRVFAIMYDVTGVPADRIQRILESDWVHLVRELGVLDSPNYLKEKGKPVIALWGFGFDGRGHTPALVRAITQFFRNNTPGGVYIMGGTPTHWRTGVGDADRNPDFPEMWLNEFDAISPWTVGRYSTEQEADNFAKTKMKDDFELITNRNQGANTRKVDYIPVIFPGFSGYNLSEGKWGFNAFKRQGGRFLWKQIYNAKQLGIRTIYGAMWDEYDEGTAFMPIVEHKRNLPVSDKYQFLSLDEDGFDVPSDWYMRICGFAAEGLRNERRIHETFPVKELQDYWSSRPKYEDVNPKSKEFRSGSLLSDKVGEEDPGGGGGQTYQEWLALQREEKEDVPPPPYTLEGVESNSPENVTSANIPSSTVATTAEVPVRNLPAVANAQPPVSSSTAARPAVNTNTYPTSHAATSSYAVPSSNIPAASPPAVNINTYPASQAASLSHAALSSSNPTASPPAVNNNTYPTSAAPASRQEAYSQVSAQSPQPSYPPAQGHSSGGVPHHPQSVAPSQGYSPQPYPPPPGVSQHPQSLPSQSHSPQPSSYPPAQGYSSGGVHNPQSVPPSQGHSPQAYPPDASQYPQSHLPSHLNSPHATSGQPVQSYPPQQQHQPYQAQNFQPYPPTSGQSPGWGQQPQPYPPGGSPYQGYPTSTGLSQGYPSTGTPPQGYAPPVPQSYSTSGGPVHQGYPPVDVQANHIYNQSQDVGALTNEFGRQSISNPSGVSSDGRLPPPPPLHPSRRPSSASLRPSSPLSSGGKLPPPPLHPEHLGRLPSSSLKPNSPSNFPNRPQSQTGHHHVTPSVPSSPGQVTSTATTSAKPHRWPPAEWESDTPPVPVQQFHGRRPSTYGHIGATLPRPQTVGASSSNISGGSSALRPTLSMSTRPSRPNTNAPSAAYLSEGTAHTHDYSDNNANPLSFPTGPAKYEQYMTFPSGPLYNSSSYSPSGYADQQQSAAAYGSWPASGHASQPPVTFPVSAMAYGAPGSPYGSQYPGGPAFPSTNSSGSGAGLNFPEGPGSSYFDASSSSSYPTPWNSTSGPPTQSPGQASSKTSGALGLALSAVDRVAGRKAREGLESQVDQIAQSKLFNKFTK